MTMSKSNTMIAGAALLLALAVPASSGAQSTRADASKQPVQYGADGGEYTPIGFDLRGRAELTQGGKQPIALPDGEQRTFLEDGDTVIFRGWCERAGAARIGLGECRATVLAAGG